MTTTTDALSSTGATTLVDTLTANNVRACFANPGTSEMHFVAALDHCPSLRPILCLFEGVATGAADGYGRMADWPACTLLHLGPGYANGAANLHNARRAYTPIVNIIGDHATYHRAYDAPLNSDIMSLARPNSVWCRSAESASEMAAITVEAIRASLTPPNGPVSLILPADTAWSGLRAEPPPKVTAPERARVDSQRIEAIARAVRAAAKPVLLLGHQAALDAGLRQAARLEALGVRVFVDTFIARQPRGAGHFAPARLPYRAEGVKAELAGVDVMILAGTDSPVAFFAYPGQPSSFVPEGCRDISLASRTEDAVHALADLADALEAPLRGPTQELHLPEAPSGKLTPLSVGVSIARHLPENAIVCDDSVTSRDGVTAASSTARPHEVLALTGGSIGIAIPLAIGAAVAKPASKVVCLSGDGAAMYTLQGLWTMARESLDVVTIVFANRSYKILHQEFTRTGAGSPHASSAALLNLTPPDLDWVSLSRGMGVPATRCQTAEEFENCFRRASAEPGPCLIEAVLA
jgi:acetolactate synthase-1/2/3 large subunit